MREPRERKFYAALADDGFPRVHHCVVGKQPDESAEITEAQALAINDELTKREAGVGRKVVKGSVSSAEIDELKVRLEKAEHFISELTKTARRLDADK